MQAETLNCPMCGAATSTDATRCLYCGARLATISCPSCFGMMFKGSRHCPHCGAKAAARTEIGEDEQRLCPRCRIQMKSIMVGATPLRDCEHCEGLWVDVASFEQICAHREQQAAVLGSASVIKRETGTSESHRRASTAVRYVPCPECGQLMNRVNFARCSGVVVDICKGHGTWFDRDELREIIEFIRAGGLETARTREKAEIAEQRRQLREEQLKLASDPRPLDSLSYDAEHRSSVVVAARELLKLLVD